MAKYMRDQFPFLGIMTTRRKEISKEFLRAAKNEKGIDWNFVNKCWEKEREFQYLALDYLWSKEKLLAPADIPSLKKLVLEQSWWDTIDSLDRLFGNIALRFPEVNKTLIAWSTDKNFWLRRIAIDHQLDRKDRTDTVLLEKIIVNNLGQTEFFINKAIGWSLREYSKTNPAWVREFLKKYDKKLAPLSKREASKYV